MYSVNESILGWTAGCINCDMASCVLHIGLIMFLSIFGFFELFFRIALPC